MYCVYDDKGNIIAFHNKKYIVEKYIDSIYSHHKISLEIGKIKKSSKYKLNKNDDLYLVRFGDTYVQTGYLMYIEMCQNQILEDDQQALDILYRLLEIRRLSKKQSKKIMKAIEVLEKVVDEDRSYVPTLQQLKNLKMDYDPYMYNTGLF